MICDVCGVRVEKMWYEVFENFKPRVICGCCMADLVDPVNPATSPLKIQYTIRRNYKVGKKQTR